MGEKTREKMNISRIPKDKHKSLYEMMLRIRKVEEKIVELYPEQEMRCPTHLSIGEEAVAVGVCEALRADDHIYSTHRCHAHYIAKGGKLKPMLAELYGKRTGCSRGKGGSMHLGAPEVGMLGTSAIVGSAIPLAVGSAFSSVFQGIDRVSVSFFGDAAVEQGTFYESLNFASLKKLPMLFVCENNLYSTQSHISKRQPRDNIYERSKPFGVPGFRVDGNDILAVYRAAKRAIARCRRGEGPTLIECRTYRWREHVGPNYDYDLGYRTREEVEEWMTRCPIKMYSEILIDLGIISQHELNNIATQLDAEITEAVAFAKNSPMPNKDELFDHVY
ncbi:thiamine pyrophosphate-dependent dehydrogenase E1 component subunit alpha [Chloroflexota bacterium]